MPRGTMGFYRNVIVPKLCNLGMRNKRLRPYRERVIGAAEGRVLEIGAGSGLNLQLYRLGATELLNAGAGSEPPPHGGKECQECPPTADVPESLGRTYSAGRRKRRYGRHNLDVVHHPRCGPRTAGAGASSKRPADCCSSSTVWLPNEMSKSGRTGSPSSGRRLAVPAI
jgi:hypothetical protein